MNETKNVELRVGDIVTLDSGWNDRHLDTFGNGARFRIASIDSRNCRLFPEFGRIPSTVDGSFYGEKENKYFYWAKSLVTLATKYPLGSRWYCSERSIEYTLDRTKNHSYSKGDSYYQEGNRVSLINLKNTKTNPFWCSNSVKDANNITENEFSKMTRNITLLTRVEEEQKVKLRVVKMKLNLLSVYEHSNTPNNADYTHGKFALVQINKTAYGKKCGKVKLFTNKSFANDDMFGFIKVEALAKDQLQNNFWGATQVRDINDISDRERESLMKNFSGVFTDTGQKAIMPLQAMSKVEKDTTPINSPKTWTGIGNIRPNKWYRVKRGPHGGKILKTSGASEFKHWGRFTENGKSFSIHEAVLTRISFHSKEVQDKIKQSKPKLFNCAVTDTCGYNQKGTRMTTVAENKANEIEAAKYMVSFKASKHAKHLEAKVTEVTDKNMGKLRAIAASYVGTENNKRIEKVKFNLLAATEANILEIEAIKAGINQPQARSINWPAIVVGLVGLTTTVIALFI